MLSPARPFLRRHLAASEGREKVVKWLLEQGADVNFLDRFKRTPLEVPRHVLCLHRDGRG